MVEHFHDYPHREHRALQIWQILIGHAHNRQTITYGQLSQMLGYGGAGTIGQLLGPIAAYCEREGLPLLNTLAVGKDTGVPSNGTFGKDTNVERERVFQHPWFEVYPPSAGNFAEAFTEAQENGWDFSILNY